MVALVEDNGLDLGTWFGLGGGVLGQGVLELGMIFGDGGRCLGLGDSDLDLGSHLG